MPGELSLLLESGATYAFGGSPIIVSGAGVRVRISTTGAAPATLDAQRLSRHFAVLGGATLELDNLILINGCPLHAWARTRALCARDDALAHMRMRTRG